MLARSGSACYDAVADIRRGITVEATSRVAVEQTGDRRAESHQGDNVAETGDDRVKPAADLRRLMVIADRYARRLVSRADAPPAALLVVHDGDLDVVMLDRLDSDLSGVRRLLQQRQASSAALVVDVRAATSEDADDLVLSLGETVGGLRHAWHYRVRWCSRGRRLTRLFGADPTFPATPEAARS